MNVAYSNYFCYPDIPLIRPSDDITLARLSQPSRKTYFETLEVDSSDGFNIYLVSRLTEVSPGRHCNLRVSDGVPRKVRLLWSSPLRSPIAGPPAHAAPFWLRCLGLAFRGMLVLSPQ